MNKLRKTESEGQARTIVFNSDKTIAETELDKEIREYQQKLIDLSNEKTQREEEFQRNILLQAEENKKTKAALLMEADQWTEKAKIYKNREDIDLALESAKYCREQAEAIEIPAEQSDLSVSDHEAAEHPGLFERLLSHTGTLYAALLFFILLAGISWWKVGDIGREINEINKVAADSGNLSQMLPPSVDKLLIQKGWYTLMVIGILLILGMLIMAFVAPAQLLFILPIININKTKKWAGFFGQDEHQKQWQSFAYVCLILVFLALCHLAGSN